MTPYSFLPPVPLVNFVIARINKGTVLFGNAYAETTQKTPFKVTSSMQCPIRVILLISYWICVFVWLLIPLSKLS